MARWRRYRLIMQIVVCGLIFPAIWSCGRSKGESAPQDSHETGAPNSSGSSPGEWGSESPASPSVPAQHIPSKAEVSPLVSHGTVMIGGEFELTVTGEGAGDPERAPGVLEQQLLAFLPQLHEVYDQQLARDPHAMGSLDVRMTIEPNGTISALRFPVKRMSSKKVTEAVYDVMRAWQFLPAEHTVDLRYRMMLVPPDIDLASISKWEKTLANRDEVDRSEKIPPTVASAPVPSGERSPASPTAAVAKKPVERMNPERLDEDSSLGETVAREEKPEERSLHPRVSNSEAEHAARFLAQWYHVTRPTALHAAPGQTAPVVARLPAGKRVWVIGIIDGDWLEVRSVNGRRPGFLPRQDAKPGQRQRAQR